MKKSNKSKAEDVELELEPKGGKKAKVKMALAAMVAPEDACKVEEAVDEFLDSITEELEAEYQKNLDEAFAQVAAEKEEESKKAIAGYNEAYEIISDLQNRLESQKEEYENNIEEQYEVAYQKIMEEQSKNQVLETQLYEKYQEELQEVKKYLVEEIDRFLTDKEVELEETIRHQVMNDPYLAETRLKWEKVVKLAENDMESGNYSHVVSSKVDEMNKMLDEKTQKIQILEARCHKVVQEKERLVEQVRASQNVITESTVKAKEEKRKNVEGKGHVETVNVTEVTKVISENVESKGNDKMVVEEVTGGEPVVSESMVNQWKFLSGNK